MPQFARHFPNNALVSSFERLHSIFASQNFPCVERIIQWPFLLPQLSSYFWASTRFIRATASALYCYTVRGNFVNVLCQSALLFRPIPLLVSLDFLPDATNHSAAGGLDFPQNTASVNRCGRLSALFAYSLTSAWFRICGFLASDVHPM